MSRLLTLCAFALAGLIAVGLEVLARRKRAPVPRLGEVVGALLAHRGARILAYALWAWLGWHLFAR